MHRQDIDEPVGLALAVSAYALWGGLPLYLKLMAYMNPGEVVAHRILWSIPVAAGVLLVMGRGRDVLDALMDPRRLAMALLTALLISVNWLTYVVAISTERALDAALGYYVNPVFSIVLAAVFLKERMQPLQMAAFALVVGAVVVLTFEHGSLPWTVILLTVSWGLYALAKRALPMPPNQGFLLEVILLSPLALGYLLWMDGDSINHFVDGTALERLLLIGCGAVTAVPLILYANGAQRVRLMTMGILQYIAPTCIFLTAVFAFNEPFTWAKKVAFPMIWAAVVFYLASQWHHSRRSRLCQAAE
ncbi:MAG: EamA family transporter RarD [Litorivicinaceae bacterium]